MLLAYDLIHFNYSSIPIVTTADGTFEFFAVIFCVFSAAIVADCSLFHKSSMARGGYDCIFGFLASVNVEFSLHFH